MHGWFQLAQAVKIVSKTEFIRRPEAVRVVQSVACVFVHGTSVQAGFPGFLQDTRDHLRVQADEVTDHRQRSRLPVKLDYSYSLRFVDSDAPSSAGRNIHRVCGLGLLSRGRIMFNQGGHRGKCKGASRACIPVLSIFDRCGLSVARRATVGS